MYVLHQVYNRLTTKKPIMYYAQGPVLGVDEGTKTSKGPCPRGMREWRERKHAGKGMFSFLPQKAVNLGHGHVLKPSGWALVSAFLQEGRHTSVAVFTLTISLNRMVKYTHRKFIQEHQNTKNVKHVIGIIASARVKRKELSAGWVLEGRLPQEERLQLDAEDRGGNGWQVNKYKVESFNLQTCWCDCEP